MYKFILAFALLTFVSCSVIKVSRISNATEAEVSTLSTTPKDVKFIGVAHIAKPEFYASVKEEITALKKDGYVLFYEWVDFDKAPDDVKRKVRKLVGLVPNDDGYANDVKEGQVMQNNDDFMHLENDLDFNVDIEAIDIINKYESMYGTLILDSTDMATPINQKITPTEPIQQTLSVILHYRNEHVVNEIKKSEYNKIVVLYGALHEKGMKKLLK